MQPSTQTEKSPAHTVSLKFWFVAILLLVTTAIVFVGAGAAPKLVSKTRQTSPLHPTFPLLDAQGEHVLESGQPVSTMRTCGECHDTSFIAGRSFHVDVGADDLQTAGNASQTFRPWDESPGHFGRWDPIAYRDLTPNGGEHMDLGTPGWIQVYGPRHVGGGPAVYTPDGRRLDEIPVVPGDPQTHVLDPETGELVAWDWTQSGVVEMNCFLCHTPGPNNEARVQALHDGAFRWANTATLLGTGIVNQSGESLVWNPDAFDKDGNLDLSRLGIQDPTNDNCGLCHGLVHDDLQEPLTISGCSPERYRTVTTGQIISPQRMADSGMNLADKQQLARAWDVHAERLVSCTDCHYALNNPVYAQESEQTRPEHLTFDPRRLELGEYLYQPLHQFARGQSAHSNLDPGLQASMRRCDSCHRIEDSHSWLPYKQRHVEAMSCETCHIPKLFTNTLQQLDWTVLTAVGEPVNTCRGIEGDPDSINALITGYQPVLLPRVDVEGETSLTPHNLVTFWYWVFDDPPRPVRLIDLKKAWFEGEAYAREIVQLFDRDGDGVLNDEELRIDSPQKEQLIARRLSALGLEQPRIRGDIQPFSVNHDVATGEWAVRDCQTCHTQDSRLTQPMQVSSYLPGDEKPTFVKALNVESSGELVQSDGALFYQPRTSNQSLYVFGHDRVPWVDRLGGFTFLATLLGVAFHGGLRFYTGLRSKPQPGEGTQVYMYGVYERLWHWLQTFTIVALMFTGLVIHRPDLFGFLSFRAIVLVHNILAATLVVNAGLALFYHLASGAIRQFLPHPVGFFGQAIEQAKYYLQGIFRRAPHPFEKTPQKKLNPLQQITYFGILNVLLPLQVITGILIWGAQRWPEVASWFGGLPFLAPFHTLVAWLFAAFIVLHVYLTTTGHTPTSNLKAMIFGWDEIELETKSEEDE